MENMSIVEKILFLHNVRGMSWQDISVILPEEYYPLLLELSEN